MHKFRFWIAVSVFAAVAGCASEAKQTGTAGADSYSGTAGSNASGHGELIGTPAVDSKFSKVRLGMLVSEVDRLIGGGDDQNHYSTGKGWIPFYYGADTQRIEVLYKGEGCLVFTGGNQFGGGRNELIRIEVDPDGNCFKS
jgi:hypothetical protein